MRYDDVKNSPLDSSILVIGAGTSGLITAKTLHDDGFHNLSVISSSDRVGGVWASGEDGGVYPGLLTNSAHGNFELSALTMPKEDLELNEWRIKGETVSRYLEEFYRRFLEGKVPFRFSTKAVEMTRDPSSRGWIVTTEESFGGKQESRRWDKVVLAQGPHSIPSFPDGLTSSAFCGLLFHTSQVHAVADVKILKAEGPVVVIGCGKSAIDLAARYASKGKNVTIVFRRPKYFAGHNLNTDYLIKTRIIATINPNQFLNTLIERFLHQTWLGAWCLRRYNRQKDASRNMSLGVTESSPLYRNDIDPIWRGPDVSGGRSSATRDDSFHILVSNRKIRAIKGVTPIAISSGGGGLVLDNGETIPAGVIICGTGFKSSFGFIRKDERVALGIEPVPPNSRLDQTVLRGHVSLYNPPALPSEEKASHVYKGIVPCGAFMERDLVTNGFQALLGIPLTAEITSHWISDFFQYDPNLRLPPTVKAACEHAERHANWLRARFPLSRIPYDTQNHFPLLNASQYNDSLLEDMGLETFREEKGWMGLGWYYNLTEVRNYENLAEERREVRRRGGRRSSLVGGLLNWLGLVKYP